MLKYEIIDLPKITIIGQEGFCMKEKNVVQDLWKQANLRFSEIADIAMKNADGTFVEFWGAMSDETMSFQPWKDDFSRGWYLASRYTKIQRFQTDGSSGSCLSGNIL